MRLAMILAVCVCTACAAQELQPEPVVQDRIQKIFTALQKSRGAAIEEAQSLKDSVRDQGEIVEQVAVFASDPNGNEAQPIGGILLLDLLDLPPKVVIPVLAPYLDSKNPKMRSFVRDWFQGHDNGGPGESPLTPVNYEDYAVYVRDRLRKNEDVPAPFVEYIYERSPGRALLVFYRGDQQRNAAARLQEERAKVEAAQREIKNRIEENGPTPKGARQQLAGEPVEIFVAEQIISHAIALKNWENGKLLPEAKKQLAKLAEDDRWWVRRYVVEIMRRHRELRDDAIMEELSEDDNTSVSKAAKGQAARAAPRAPDNVQARAIGPTSTEITWQASNGATSYTVQRRQPDTETEFTTIAPNVAATSYTDSDLAKDTLYQYRVIAHEQP